jgi:integrase
MPRLKLTKTTVQKLSAPDTGGKQALHWDTDLKGFGVLCSGKTNAKSYVVQHDVQNGPKGRRITIGPTNVLQVGDARQQATELIALMLRGVDPKAKAKAEQEIRAVDKLTLSDALEIYLTARKDLKPKSASDYRRSVERYLSDWLDKPLKKITPDQVEERHREIQQAVARRRQTSLAKGHSAANTTMRVLRLVWNHAAERNSSLPANPVKRLRRAWYPEDRRETVIRRTDLPKFFAALTDQTVVPNSVQRDYIRFVLFTGLRRQEAASLRWDEVDLDERVVRLSGKRTKSGRRLDLPMSDYMHDLLQSRRSIGLDGPYVFPANSRSGHIAEPRHALDAIEKAADIKATVHDLRRTFVTVAESCDISAYALKGLVNHSYGNDVTAGYIVSDQDRLREPMQKVTDRLRELIQA